ncbi:hypothetical protein FPRO04_13134 [Fusarium proliferatum]|nr:hypothetical protein FPRO04_13134 [Fusarium proliferatum]
MAQRKVPVKLRKLELQESWPKNDEGSIYMDEDDPIAFLLDSFEGLEEFYLSQIGGMRSILTWHHVCHHKSTLKIFVNHSRFYEERNRRWWDQPDMMLRDWNTTPFRDDPTSTPLYRLDTEFISLSCAPKFLNDNYVLNPFSRKECLKIVHLRQSRSDMGPDSETWAVTIVEDEEPIDNAPAVDEGDNPSKEYLHCAFWTFIQRVFSPKGIKSLEYIVFGDYGRPERTSRGNLLICRERYGSQDSRIIRESCPEPEWYYIKKEYGDALRSCPSDPLFDTPEVQRYKHRWAQFIANVTRSP